MTQRQAPAPSTPTAFATLLKNAVTEPGIISQAYTAFHNYSLGNQLLALSQCLNRGIQPGPIGTFPHWKKLGRHVRKGQKAIVLCRPVTVKRTKPTATTADDNGADETMTFFVYKPLWFVLAQTDGPPVPDLLIPAWDKDRALAVLDIQETAFEGLDGNVMGCASGRTVAVSSLNSMPWKTRFHEIGHVLLGHTSEGEQNDDSELTPRNLRECEAESVALLCCGALNLPGVAESRGYIQNWWGQGNDIPERSAQKVLKVADAILKAGREDGVVA